MKTKFKVLKTAKDITQIALNAIENEITSLQLLKPVIELEFVKCANMVRNQLKNDN